MTEACCMCGGLWGLLVVLSCALLGVSSSAVAGETTRGRHHYVVHHDAVSFDDALRQCSHSSREGGGGGGVLTTLASQQEVQDVLAAVAPSSLPDGPSGGAAGHGGGGHNFWLGLRKAKTDCVVPHLPLKGFKWTADGSETTQVHGGYRWRKEPPETCTGLRCLLLSVESREDWALADSSCSKRHPFICKYHIVATADTEAEAAPAETDDGRQETRDVDVEATDPVTRLPSATAAPHPDARPTTTPTAASSPPEQPTQPPRALPTQPPPPSPPPPSSSSSSSSPSQPQQPHVVPGLEMKGDCRDAPVVNGSRSLRQHPDQPGRMTLECWSGTEVELNCSEATTGGRWEVVAGGGGALLLDRSLDDVCARCDAGFQKDDDTWTCRDVDECQSAPCGGGGQGCVNTPGSYRCVCYDAQGAARDLGSDACVLPDGGGAGGGAEVETADHAGAQSGILIPALIAAAVLLLLLAARPWARPWRCGAVWPDETRNEPRRRRTTRWPWTARTPWRQPMRKRRFEKIILSDEHRFPISDSFTWARYREIAVHVLVSGAARFDQLIGSRTDSELRC